MGDFPNNPSAGDTYAFQSVTYTYTGGAWYSGGGFVSGSGSGSGADGPTGPTGPTGGAEVYVTGSTGGPPSWWISSANTGDLYIEVI